MALTGNETLQVTGVLPSGSPSGVSQQTTTGAIAGLSGSGTTVDITSTPITTVGAGTLTAAAMLGGLIIRTGPVAAYTDTTDTAANILTAIGAFVSGSTFFMTIKNATAFTQTLAGGTGVTLPLTIVVGPWQEAQYYGVIGGTAASPTVTLNHLLTSAISLSMNVVTPVITTLATNGAGTLLAAAINGGFINRTTVAAAFTDTTDTASAIIAGNPGLVGKIGSSMLFRYQNSSTATATLAGGTGVTVSGVTAVPAGTWALYVVTYTAAATITMVGVASAPPVTTSGTFVANGTSAVTVANTNISANSSVVVTLKTVGGTVGAIPAIKTITAGTGFTIAGTASDTSTYQYLIIG